jgi:hypothetical protein
MQERRREQRRRTYLGGKVIFNNRMSIVDCLVRNTSDSGARLVLENATVVPTSFQLDVPCRDKTYRATLKWRSHDQTGVELAVAKQADDPAPFERDEEVSRLKKGNAALRRYLESQEQGF